MSNIDKRTSRSLSTNFSNFYAKVITRITSEIDAIKEMDAKMWPIIRQNRQEFTDYLRKKAKNTLRRGGVLSPVLLSITECPQDVLGQRMYSFTNETPPDVSGEFVYFINTVSIGKVGKHTGPLSRLCSRYFTYYPRFEVIAFNCSGYDVLAVEKAILGIMKAAGAITTGENVVPSSIELFKKSLHVFFGFNGENNTPGQDNLTINFPETVDNENPESMLKLWYSVFLNDYTYTKKSTDIIPLEFIHKQFLNYLLDGEHPLVAFKEFEQNIKQLEPRLVDKYVVGIARKERVVIPKVFSKLQRLYQENPFWNEHADGWTKQQVFVDIMKQDFPNDNYTCHDVNLMFTKLGMDCCRKKTILWKMLPYEEFKANMEHLKYWDDSV